MADMMPPKVPWDDRNSAFTQDESFRLLDAYMRSNGFADHHIKSYDDFMDVQMAQCLFEHEHEPIDAVYTDSKSKRTFRHELVIVGFRYGEPCLQEESNTLERVTPVECMLRREAYEVPLHIDFRYTIYEVFGYKEPTSKHKRKPRQTDESTDMNDESVTAPACTEKKISSTLYRDHLFDWIPCMKHSSKCALTHSPDYKHEDLYDTGGIFLPNGAEKVVVGQEEIRNNYPFVLVHPTSKVHTCEYRSYDHKRIRSTSTMDIVLTPPRDDTGSRVTMVPRVVVKIPFLSKSQIALVLAYRLMGVHDIQTMHEYICEPSDSDWFRRNIMKILQLDRDAMFLNRDEVIRRIMNERPTTDFQKATQHVDNILAGEFLPNQGYNRTDLPAKIICFTAMVRKIIRVFYGLTPADDRDHYMHRRCRMCGPMLALLARNAINQFRRKCSSSLAKAVEQLATKPSSSMPQGSGAFAVAAGSNTGPARPVNVLPLMKGSIGAQLGYALSTGNFSMQRGQNNAMNGISQPLQRISEPFSSVSHLRTIMHPMNKDSRSIKARLLDPSSWGVVCPYQTPEGAPCGLRRNLAMTTGIRVGHPTEVLCKAILLTGLVNEEGRYDPHPSRARVFVNGYLLGTVRNHCVPLGQTPETAIIDHLREMRAKQNLPIDVSIYYADSTWATVDAGEVHVSGDAGSYYWPLLRVDKLGLLREILDGKHHVGRLDLYNYMLTHRVIELINKDEETISVRLAFYPEDIAKHPPGTFTHLCMHPLQVLSVTTARGPHIEFNQAPRVVYQACMGKQSIGACMSNEKYRFDAMTHWLWYPQKPLCSTWVDRQFSEVGSCFNPVVAVMPIADNQEDSIVYNKQSLDNGMFTSTMTRTLTTVARKHGAEEEHVEVPPTGTKSMLMGSYDAIDPATGVALVGARLDDGDVAISKTVHTRVKRKMIQSDGKEISEDVESVRDRSVSCKASGTVSSVMFYDSVSGNKGVRVKTSTTCNMEPGDKAASRFGQKGVAGAIWDAVDMPFDPETGRAVDLIINVHAFPSRMTIGHIYDTIMSTLACAQGEIMDGTAWTWSHKFEDNPDSNALAEHLGDELEKRGLDRYCNRRLCDGATGKLYETTIFYGVCPYQKLKHMVRDKEHARRVGPVNILTRQPPEGRGHDGGLRFGEMERDNAISHGAAHILRDRFITASDGFMVHVCVRCGQLAQPPKQPTADQLIISSTESGMRPFCRACNSHEQILLIKLPYMFKLWIQEMNCMSMVPRFKFEPTDTLTVNK